MSQINLLPWRDRLRRHHIRKKNVYWMVVVFLITGIFLRMNHHGNVLLKQQLLQNKQLESELTVLKIRRLKDDHQQKRGSMKGYQTQRTRRDFERIEPLSAEFIQVNYAKAIDLVALLKENGTALLSPRGVSMVDARTNVIWVNDIAANLEHVKKWIKRLDVPNKQVAIEARIVNMAKDSAQDLGVRFGVSGLTPSANDINNGRTESSPTGSTSVPSGFNMDLSAIPLEATPASIGIALATLNEHVLLDLELSALENEGRAEIIASPRLITTNQESAVIESGEDIPYQEFAANGTTSVAFKKAVLSLKVVPQITADNKLMMALSINQGSDSGKRVQGVPIILTKSIETNVLVKNGQTIVLGGIYQQDKSHSLTRVPFLGELPVIGHLFRRKQVRRRNEELLIFITPRIITEN